MSDSMLPTEHCTLKSCLAVMSMATETIIYRRDETFYVASYVHYDIAYSLSPLILAVLVTRL